MTARTAPGLTYGEAAVSTFCGELPENPEATETAIERMRAFRSQLGFKE